MDNMKTYCEIAMTAPADRRIMAYDLARQLDTLSEQLEAYAETIHNHPTVLIDPQESKLYFTLMRTFVSTQKQFQKLLPVEMLANADALAVFNSGS